MKSMLQFREPAHIAEWFLTNRIREGQKPQNFVVLGFQFVPGEARLSEKCSLYRILEHVDDDSFRMSVCLHGGIKTAAR